MKKGIITVFVTLFIFFSSTVGIFALEDSSYNTTVEYWVYDLLLQSQRPQNISDCSFGYVENSNYKYFALQLAKGKSVTFTYNVPGNETVYFRWASPIASHRYEYVTTVTTVVNGITVDSSDYYYEGDGIVFGLDGIGDYGSNGSIVINQDYTNPDDETILVSFTISNDDYFDVMYLPLKCGTSAYFDDTIGSVSGSTSVDINVSTLEDKLIDVENELKDINYYSSEILIECVSNGQLLTTSNSLLSSIVSKLSSTNSYLFNIQNEFNTANAYLNIINGNVINIDKNVVKVLSTLNNIDLTTLHMKDTLDNIYDLLLDGLDNSKKDNLDNANSSLSSTLGTYNELDTTLFEGFSESNLAITDIVDDVSSNQGILNSLYFTSVLIDGFISSHFGLEEMLSCFLIFGLALFLIGRGTKL